MRSMAHITVDGRGLDAPVGAPLLHALEDAGFAVPSLCDDRRLAAFGECRMCLVRVDGRAQPLASCATPVEDGMVVETEGDELDATRAGLLGMLARHYPAAAVRDSPERPLHRLFARYDVIPSGDDDAGLRDDSHPCIAVDMNRCIDCFRCVRICDEVQGQFAWQIKGRGPDTHVVPAGGGTFRESPCVACGACVDTCPTGALEDRGRARARRSDALDAHDVPVLRRRLRAARRYARRQDRHRGPRARRAGEQWPRCA